VHLERKLELPGDELELADRRDELARLDRHQHAAVAEPLGDPDTEVGGDLAHAAAEQGEHANGFVVAELVAERGEAREIDERKPSLDSHGVILALRSGQTLNEAHDRLGDATERVTGGQSARFQWLEAV